jgi:subtilisin family serine protease
VRGRVAAVVVTVATVLTSGRWVPIDAAESPSDRPRRAAEAEAARRTDALWGRALAVTPVAAGESLEVVVAERTPEGSLRISRQRAASAVAGRAKVADAVAAGAVVAVGIDRRVSLEDPLAEPLTGPVPGMLAGRLDGSRDTAAAAGPDLYRSAQWALDATTFEAARATGNGSGVVVAVVDTGVDAAHEDLAGRVLPGRHFFRDDAGNPVQGPGADDDHRHGTHVAGIIAAVAGNGIGVAGAAPGATVLPVKVLDATGRGWLSDIAQGIVWAADQGADIVNLSLGAEGMDVDPVLHAAVLYAVGKGAALFAASGNSGCLVDGEACLALQPAAEPGVVAVGSLGDTGTPPDVQVCSPFTTRGGYVDVAAPGYRILSAFPTTLTAPGGVPYAFSSGTSMATPFASAAAALVRSAHPTRTMSDVVWALGASALDVVESGLDTCSGAGLVDPAAAVQFLTTHPDSPSAGGPAAPQVTGAVAGRGMIRVAFRVPAGVDAVRVYRDGVLIATVAPSSRGFVDRSPGSDVRSYEVSSVGGMQEGSRSTARTATAR